MRVALAQPNLTVGDIDANVERLAAWSREATGHGADVVCFPELAITGYPPEDLVLRREFVDDNLQALEDL
ncbi:MAG TPA: nitrilase-related carbon-nitrogen hydrolase, partial [Actinomycetota bacterium]|nr:nitrilase-related carbon-nitrogen hydrolase [Actinomycetota bacterium]